MNWIKYVLAITPIDTLLLVYNDKEGIVSAYYCPVNERWMDGNGESLTWIPSHWMPLPDPPIAESVPGALVHPVVGCGLSNGEKP